MPHPRQPGRRLAAAGVWLALAAAPLAGAARPAEHVGTEVLVWPDRVVLDGSKAFQQLLVTLRSAAGPDRDATGAASFTSSNPAVATVDAAGRIASTGEGEATVTVRAGGRTATVAVVARGFRRPFAPRFADQVVPVLTKAGCNSGACHGAAAGKNGFKLTLRGYDPELDHLVLTRQALGRRVDRLAPARSLMLLKPTLALPHGGGKRFGTDSREYDVLASWIAAGAPGPSERDPSLLGLEVFPSSATLEPGAEQQVGVLARFSDGHSEDVTRWAIFNSSDAAVATVRDDGRVRMQGRGEAAITVYYLSRVAAARVAVPFDNPVADESYRTFRPAGFIDELVLRKLRGLRIPPSEPATDAEFVRRAYLDAIGTLPRPDEVARFLEDPRPDRRARLVDALLERKEYVDYWTTKWSDVLLVSSRKLQPRSMRAYHGFIRDAVARNVPFDRFAYEILTASGNSAENGAVNYFLVQKSPIDLAENTTQAFLGMRLTCARCHNHPLEKWTQKDYYGFANLFTRVSLKNSPSGDVTVFSSGSGDILHPRLLVPMAPRPLDAPAVSLDAAEDRRVVLARWLTSKENPFFARVTVNRIWKNFMGRGLVEAVDDVRSTNPASNEDLLQALARRFAERGFDCKDLIRTIMGSAAYQLSSRTVPANAADDRYYSHYLVRRLPAEVILDAVSQVTGVPQEFPGYPRGTRALELPDSRVDSYFLTAFGRPDRIIPCACERQQDPSLAQALHLINGETVNGKIIRTDSLAETYLKLGLSAPMLVDHLYLSTLARHPSESEAREILEAFRQAEAMPASAAHDPRREFIEDLIWAVISGREFLFNH